MAGSTDRCETVTTSCPSAGSGTSSVVSDQSVARGSPEGRAARRIWWLVSDMRAPPSARSDDRTLMPAEPGRQPGDASRRLDAILIGLRILTPWISTAVRQAIAGIVGSILALVVAAKAGDRSAVSRCIAQFAN